jgi:hypothetical protein
MAASRLDWLAGLAKVRCAAGRRKEFWLSEL